MNTEIKVVCPKDEEFASRLAQEVLERLSAIQTENYRLHGRLFAVWAALNGTWINIDDVKPDDDCYSAALDLVLRLRRRLSKEGISLTEWGCLPSDHPA